MFNSHSDYVNWIKGGEVYNSGIDSDSGWAETAYTRVLETPQVVRTIINGSETFIDVYGLQQMTEFSRVVDGVLTILRTDIYFGGYLFALAVFLALVIDWNPREPIIWVLHASADVYNAPFTFPVFVDPVSVNWTPIPNDSLSTYLSSL